MPVTVKTIEGVASERYKQMATSFARLAANREGDAPMRRPRIQAAAVLLACLMLAGQAFAQNAPKPPDANEEFLVGLRRVGVMAGQVVQCSADADKPGKIAEAMELANQIAIHFGLKAAFNYVGAVGFGSGRAFDKAGCAQSIAGWKEVQTKYLNK